MYLLNKDIESVSPSVSEDSAVGLQADPSLFRLQLMIDRDIKIMDIRHTLPNLMNLLLTVSSDWPAK